MVLAVFEMSWIWGLRNCLILSPKMFFFLFVCVSPLPQTALFYANRVTFLTGLTVSRFPGSVPELLLIIARTMSCLLSGAEIVSQRIPHWVSMAQFKYAYHAHSLAGSNSREHGHHEHPGGLEVWCLEVGSQLRSPQHIPSEGELSGAPPVAAITPVSMLVFLKLGINSAS